MYRTIIGALPGGGSVNKFMAKTLPESTTTYGDIAGTGAFLTGGYLAVNAAGEAIGYGKERVRTNNELEDMARMAAIRNTGARMEQEYLREMYDKEMQQQLAMAAMVGGSNNQIIQGAYR
jgi:hypothetical protein